jgi:hypothetical protein
VHGVPSVCFPGESFLGDGLLLGKASRPIRKDGPWIELDGLCDPERLEPWLVEAVQVFSEMECAHHAPWVQAAQDHGLRLEWEREQRVPRLAGLVRGIGVRVSWMAEGGARVNLLLKEGQVFSVERAQVQVEQRGSSVVFIIALDELPELSGLLARAFSAI